MNVLKTSFFTKKLNTCPVCKYTFKIETMRTGGGRFLSIGIGPDLRRLYTATKKYGNIYPLIYDVLVCPNCWFAALPIDFFDQSKFDLKALINSEKIRKNAAQEFFSTHFDFSKHRNLEMGLISYFLAIFCYNYFTIKSVASANKFLASLRAAWCADDLAKLNNKNKFYKIGLYFRKLSYDCLQSHMKSMYENKERVTEVEHYGPDLDHNYGYKGFVYLSCYFGYIFSDVNNNIEEEYTLLKISRNQLSKEFGIGKVSKSSPSPLKRNVRNTYEMIKIKMEDIKKKHPTLIAKDKK